MIARLGARPKGRLAFSDYAALFRSFIRQGIIARYRVSYWSFLRQNLHPRAETPWARGHAGHHGAPLLHPVPADAIETDDLIHGTILDKGPVEDLRSGRRRDNLRPLKIANEARRGNDRPQVKPERGINYLRQRPDGGWDLKVISFGFI